MPKRKDAFVVWLDRKRGRQPVDPEEFSGRVEHVRTSRRAHFTSTEELVRFLTDQPDEEPPAQGAEELKDA